MNTGKTLFAQLMDFLPWSTFTRIVARYDGDHRVRTLSCAEQYRAMAFAQLTYRESLRDIEVCLSAQTAKLYHMGFREPVRRSTLADANETRDWRIYAEFAQRLIAQARRLYAGDSLGLDLTNTVYALDSTTIDLCLSVFPWAHFRSTKAAVKMHTLLDLRGNIPELHPHLGRQTARRSCARSAAPRARRHLRHGSRLRRFRAASRAASGRRLLRHPRQVEPGCPSRLFGADRSSAAASSAIRPSRWTAIHTSQHYPAHLRRIRFKDPETGKTLVFLTNQLTLPAATICALYKSRWQVELFFKWIKQHLRIKQFYGTSENAVKTQIWIAVSVYVLVAIVKKRLKLDASLYTLLQILSVTLFEKMPILQALSQDQPKSTDPVPDNQISGHILPVSVIRTRRPRRLRPYRFCIGCIRPRSHSKTSSH